jgi:hypothetical protein
MVVIDAVDPARLPSMPLSERKQFPEIACVYFVLDADGGLQHIGRTGRLRRRWLSHPSARWADRVAWLETGAAEDQIGIEEALIQRFRPPQNGKAYIPGTMASDHSTVTVSLNVAVASQVRDRLTMLAVADYRSLSNFVRQVIERETGRSLQDILTAAVEPPAPSPPDRP